MQTSSDPTRPRFYLPDVLRIDRPVGDRLANLMVCRCVFFFFLRVYAHCIGSDWLTVGVIRATIHELNQSGSNQPRKIPAKSRGNHSRVH